MNQPTSPFTIESLPPLQIPTPVMALLPDRQGGFWAGGPGGVAHYDGARWTPLISGLPLTRVTALLDTGTWLLAGGLEGIARSPDGGRSWQRGGLPGQVGMLTGLAAAPAGDRDGGLLAATLRAGILRSEDDGLTWQAASFGLQTDEVLALLWTDGVLLAGTPDGIYRSPNQGRAWKLAYDGDPVAALTRLADGSLLAATETGHLLMSSVKEGGGRWRDTGWQVEQAITAVVAAADGALIGTDGGIYFWREAATVPGEPPVGGTVFALAVAGTGQIIAGIEGGIQVGEPDGSRWATLPPPPLHDVRQVILTDTAVLVGGRFSGRWRYQSDWQPVPGPPLPLSLLTRQHGVIYATGPEGLYHSTDDGASWSALWAGAGGDLAPLAMQSTGVGYGSSADGSYLARTLDGGSTWQVTPSPFGVLPVLTLQASDRLIFAGVYDPRRRVIALWRSLDGGQRWLPGAEIPAEWALAASYMLETPGDPGLLALLALPEMLLVAPANPADPWRRAQFDVPGVTLRTISGDAADHGARLFALSLAHGIFQSSDGGLTWTRLRLDLPVDQLMDLSYHADSYRTGRLAVLLVGGQVIIIHV